MAQWVVVTVVDGDDPINRIEPVEWLWRRLLPDGMTEDVPAMKNFVTDFVGPQAAKAYEPGDVDGG